MNPSDAHTSPTTPNPNPSASPADSAPSSHTTANDTSAPSTPTATPAPAATDIPPPPAPPVVPELVEPAAPTLPELPSDAVLASTGAFGSDTGTPASTTNNGGVEPPVEEPEPAAMPPELPPTGAAPALPELPPIEAAGPPPTIPPPPITDDQAQGLLDEGFFHTDEVDGVSPPSAVASSSTVTPGDDVDESRPSWFAGVNDKLAAARDWIARMRSRGTSSPPPTDDAGSADATAAGFHDKKAALIAAGVLALMLALVAGTVYMTSTSDDPSTDDPATAAVTDPDPAPAPPPTTDPDPVPVPDPAPAPPPAATTVTLKCEYTAEAAVLCRGNFDLINERTVWLPADRQQPAPAPALANIELNTQDGNTVKAWATLSPVTITEGQPGDLGDVTFAALSAPHGPVAPPQQ